MFCVHCGVENPDIGSFCRRCGKALMKDDTGASSSTVTQAVQVENAAPSLGTILVANVAEPVRPQKAVPQTDQRQKATALVVLFSILVLGTSTRSLTRAASAAASGEYEIMAISTLWGLFTIIGLIRSIRWRVSVAGYRKTSGRQGTAIFLIGFCAWGLLLTLILGVKAVTTRETPAVLAIPVIMAVLYIAGLLGCVHWLRKLRRIERTSPDWVQSSNEHVDEQRIGLTIDEAECPWCHVKGAQVVQSDAGVRVRCSGCSREYDM